jgi:excisionase family DNA binding protein
MNTKTVFTTGHIANLLHIHQTTVIDWVDKGMLESYKTPGGHRRITKDALLRFLDAHKMPVPHALSAGPHAGTDEAHRHLHEGFQIGPQSKPMEAFPPFPKNGGVRNTARKVRLATKKV